MKILSMDVGIKNLSYCILDSETLKIIDWGLIDCLKNKQEERNKCDLCKSDCFYAYNYVELPKRLNLCKRHSKKFESTKIKFLEEEYKINNDEKCSICSKKGKVIFNDEVYCSTHYNQKNKLKKIKIKKVNCNTTNLKDILINTIKILDSENSNFLDCDKVIIELQPGKKKKMQAVANNLYSYFLIRGVLNDESNINDVDYISATQKLYIYPKEFKNTYKKRKKLSVHITKGYIEETQSEEIKKVFDNNKKKDDLGDALLQCLSYLYKLPKIDLKKVKL
jgi:hypothetical protein